MSSLQHHLLAITQRLHTSELERKELRTQLSQLSSRLGDYKVVVVVVVVLTGAYTGYVESEVGVTARAGEAPTPRLGRPLDYKEANVSVKFGFSLGPWLLSVCPYVTTFFWEGPKITSKG